MTRYRAFGEITGKYNTLVIDPPWDIPLAGQFEGKAHRPMHMPYPTMSLEEIKNLNIKGICNPGAHVYLWTTNRFLKDAFEILGSWGIRFHIVLTMVKPAGMAPSLGYVFGTEFCLMGFYNSGMQKFLKTGALNWFKNINLKGNHSRKPDHFYKMVEMMSPGPRVDLFSRRLRKDWDVMGNEVDFEQTELFID